ncbi:MAG: M17 family peptidase N-terminal domain-containing protein, partial [Pseudomonadota bacterium]
MDITTSNAALKTLRTECLVLPVGKQNALSGCAAVVDQACDGLISVVLKQGDLADKPGSTVTLHHLPQIKARRLLLISTGKDPVSAATYDQVAMAQAKALVAMNIKDATSCLLDVKVSDRDTTHKAQSLAQAVVISLYQFDLHKSKKSKPFALKKIALHCDNKKENKAAGNGIDRGIGIGHGMDTARDLGNMAANVCTPTYLAEHAKALKKSHPSLKVSVLGETQMAKLKMGALLSVSAGSEEEAKLICMEHRGGKTNARPVVLVGKGITCDTGGISIKPSAGMDEMKFDMCGAASVFGVMRAVAELNLPINVIGVVAAA